MTQPAQTVVHPPVLHVQQVDKMAYLYMFSVVEAGCVPSVSPGMLLV